MEAELSQHADGGDERRSVISGSGLPEAEADAGTFLPGFLVRPDLEELDLCGERELTRQGRERWEMREF